MSELKPIPFVNLEGKLIEWWWEDTVAVSESIHHDGKWIGSIHREAGSKRIVGVTIHVEAISGMTSLVAAMAGSTYYSPLLPRDSED